LLLCFVQTEQWQLPWSSQSLPRRCNSSPRLSL